MKSNEELYYKVCQPTRFPRGMLKPISQSGRQDEPDQEAFHQDASGSFVETTAATSTTMGKIEIFELCETCSKTQCPDCALYWQVGIVYCSCGRTLKPSQRTKQLDKKNSDALSIPGYVIKKNLKHGAKHGASERQRMYYKAEEMLQNARQPKHGGSETILERWHKDNDYGKALSEIGWTEEQIIQCHKLALEDHTYIATPKERAHNEKNWVLSLNKRVQGPFNILILLKQNKN